MVSNENKFIIINFENIFLFSLTPDWNEVTWVTHGRVFFLNHHTTLMYYKINKSYKKSLKNKKHFK